VLSTKRSNAVAIMLSKFPSLDKIREGVCARACVCVLVCVCLCVCVCVFK